MTDTDDDLLRADHGSVGVDMPAAGGGAAAQRAERGLMHVLMHGRSPH